MKFERGTISYIISATLTRPTSISATTNCDRKVYLQERVDVGLLPPPLARTITLEPIPKKARKKKTVPVEKTNGGGSATSSDPPEPASDLDSIRATENSGDSSVNFEETQHEFAVGNTPRSPVQSDVRSDASGESAVSGSTGRSGRGPNATADQSNVVTVQTATGKAPTAEKSITATISVPKGGYLPGDVVTVKINVQHRKVVKSMHGVIVTFYRQGRIDYDPPLAAFKRTGDDGKDEYWPRSKTGLGGLSLSSAGSFSVFRKDLSQSISPLIIDPATLTANINASVRVPQDTFSTIEGLPGEMLSFKYHVEVIVDLGGKLANQFIQGGNVKRLGMSGGVTKGIPDESDPGQISAWGGKMIDTDQLRREKGVVAVSFDITIGTVDSTRVRGKAPVWPTHPSLSQHMYDGPGRDGLPHAAGRGNGFHDLAAEDLSPQPPEAPAQPAQVAQPAQPYYPSSPTLMMSRFNLSGSFPAPQYIPPPQLPDESTLTEKERIRLAEERLLPSQPPPAPTATGTTAMAGPSAPPLSPTDDNIYDAEDATSLSNGPSLEPSAPPFPLPPADGAPGGIGVGPHATAPTLDAIAFSESAVNHATDDKQELERQRLLAEASAPPEFPDDYDDGAGQPSTSVTGGPSAPPLDAVDPSAAPSAPAPYDDDDGVNLPPSAPYEIDDSVHYGPQYSYQAAMPGPSSPSGPSSPHHPSTSGVLPPPEPLPKYEK